MVTYSVYLFSKNKLIILFLLIMLFSLSCIKQQRYQQEIIALNWEENDTIFFLYSNAISRDVVLQQNLPFFSHHFLFSIHANGRDLNLLRELTPLTSSPSDDSLDNNNPTITMNTELKLLANSERTSSKISQVHKNEKDGFIHYMSLTNDEQFLITRVFIFEGPNINKIVDLSSMKTVKLTSPEIPREIEFVAKWTSFNHDIFISYVDNFVAHHGIGEIDINTGQIKNLKIFKKYEVSLRTIDVFLNDLAVFDNRDTRFKLLGFVSPKTVRYIISEKGSDIAKVLEHNIDEDKITELGRFNTQDSYVSLLRVQEQVSPDVSKVAYVDIKDSTDFIIISNIDNTNKRYILNVNEDLPKGDLITTL